MKTISIRELHNRTGHYVRRAATEPLTITDRGETIARIVPTLPVQRMDKPFPKRNRAQMPRTGLDSTVLVSADRDGR